MLGLLVITLLVVIGFSINHTLDNEFFGLNTSSAREGIQQKAADFPVRKNDSFQSQSPIIQPEKYASKDPIKKVDKSEQVIPANTPMPQPESPVEVAAPKPVVEVETS